MMMLLGRPPVRGPLRIATRARIRSSVPPLPPASARLGLMGVLGAAAVQQASACIDSSASAPQTLSLFVLTAYSAGLLFDASVLAAGGAITLDGRINVEFLDLLTDTRLKVHAFTPLMALVGLDLARTAGAGWASSDLQTLAASFVCGVVMMLTAVRNEFVLSTRLRRSGGLTFFTYDDTGFDFTRRIPVSFAATAIAATSALATLDEPAMLRVFAISAVCLVVNTAVPEGCEAPLVRGPAQAALVYALASAYAELLR